MKNPLEKNPKTTDEKFDYIISLIGNLATKDELNELNGKVDSVTKNTDKKFDHVIGLIGGLATKAELAESVSNLATKDDLNNLAIMTANSFAHTATKEDIAELKERVAVVEEITTNTRQDVLNIGDKFVSRAEFDNHVVKFGNLEKKVAEFA